MKVESFCHKRYPNDHQETKRQNFERRMLRNEVHDRFGSDEHDKN